MHKKTSSAFPIGSREMSLHAGTKNTDPMDASLLHRRIFFSDSTRTILGPSTPGMVKPLLVSFLARLLTKNSRTGGT